ncbi:MAG: hypothetical protein WC076_04530 [Terrimicrobiaceae bacterium]|nr:hypothetical protein [Terrimicrobiaceae bacterium]
MTALLRDESPKRRRIDLLAPAPPSRQKEAMRRLILLPAILFPVLLHAELPPSAYERMQKAATEVVGIEVLRVDIEPGDSPERQNVHLMALVNTVTRAANVKEGDVIHIRYTVADREKGWVGPGEIPILGEKDKTVAYLVKDSASEDFHPAAGAMSFRDF